MDRAKVVAAAKLVGTWLPALMLVLMFSTQGWSKFSDTSGWSTAFRTWGYPDWFRVGVGVAELAAALLLLLGRTAPLGALLIIGVMLGGMSTHLQFDQGRHMTSEVVPIILATIVLTLRRDQFRALAARVHVKPMTALGVILAALLAWAAAAPKVLAAQAPPQTVTLTQFKKLQWIAGTWRGTGDDIPVFFEEYRVLDDSTIAVRALSDSTLSVVSDTSTIMWRNGIVQRKSARTTSFAVTLTDTSVHFLRQGTAVGGFTFARASADHWIATLHASNAAGRERTYLMRRVRP